MRHLLTIIFILTCFLAKSQPVSPAFSLVGNSSKTSLTAKLGIPFGTIAKLEAEIYDGDNLPRKGYEGSYLLKVIAVNGKIIKGTILLGFIDETKTLANEDSSLYRLIYKKEPPELSEAQVNKMKKMYVGKKLTLMAYETGHFTGIPKGPSKYIPIRQDVFFCFQHYLMVVANLKK